MRTILQHLPDHKPAAAAGNRPGPLVTPAPLCRRPAASALLLILLLIPPLVPLAGCRSGEEPAHTAKADAPVAVPGRAAAGPRPTAAKTSPEPEGCSAVVSTAALETWQALGQKLLAGVEVHQDAFEQLCRQPDYTRWLNTPGAGTANPHILGNVMRYVFAPAANQRGRLPKRRDLVDNFTYVRDRPDSVASFLRRFRAENASCTVLAKVHGFLRQKSLPDTLAIAFLTMGPEIRYVQGRLLVDTGLAVAAGIDQLTDLLASLLYRNLALPAGPAPHETSGRAALAATLDKLRYEGIAAWLECYPDLRFDPAHPHLGQSQQARQHVLANAAEALEGMNKYLAILLEDPEQLRTRGNLVDDVLRGMGAYPTAGYAMAALIAARISPERLRACSASTLPFLRAYQEAALARTDDPLDLMNRLPPIPAPDFGRLVAALEQETSAGG